jgi:large subunit ribosomal protein L13
MQTTFPKQEKAQHGWFITSAKGQVLGRLATRVASALMGKHKVIFTPSVDNGDHVVVTDVEALVVTGRKATDKMYRHHTGYIGGLHEMPFHKMQAQRPEEILHLAVKRMLPKTVNGSAMIKRLKLYKGAAHPHAAQNPQPL